MERVKFEDIPETYKRENMERVRELVATHLLPMNPNANEDDVEELNQLVLRQFYESDVKSQTIPRGNWDCQRG